MSELERVLRELARLTGRLGGAAGEPEPTPSDPKATDQAATAPGAKRPLARRTERRAK